MKILELKTLDTATTQDFDKVKNNLYQRYMVIDSKLNRILDIYIGYRGSYTMVVLQGSTSTESFSGVSVSRNGYLSYCLLSAFKKAGFKFDNYDYGEETRSIIELVAKKITRKKFKIFC